MVYLLPTFFEGTLEKWVYERPPKDGTTRDGPPICRRSVLGYDQSGHIPNANQNDSEVPEVVLGSGEQRSNTGHKETSGSGPGFGPLVPANLAGFTAKLAKRGFRSRVEKRACVPRTVRQRRTVLHTYVDCTRGCTGPASSRYL